MKYRQLVLPPLLISQTVLLWCAQYKLNCNKEIKNKINIFLNMDLNFVYFMPFLNNGCFIFLIVCLWSEIQPIDTCGY